MRREGRRTLEPLAETAKEPLELDREVDAVPSDVRVDGTEGGREV